MGLSWSEMLLLGVAAVVIFGKDLPKVAREAGRMIHRIQRTVRDVWKFDA